MGYRRIVVGTDGSETAGLAVRAAARLAKRCRADLLIVCGFEPPEMPVDRAQRVLAEAQASAEGEGARALTEMQLGLGGDVILDVARRREADLIVVGNRGLGKARRFGLGGVPDQVAHHAPCDVLITRTTGDGPTGNGGVYTSMLVGTDGSPTASEAARKAFELAMMIRANVALIHVGDPIVGSIVLEETAAGKLGRTAVTTHAEGGDPSEQIVRVAEREGADLIVVGNKGMAGARRYLLGSVPNRVAHEATTDVLIAKTVGRTADDLAPGHGGVVDLGGRMLAVYKDEAGGLHALSPRCTHMGCTVDWNDVDRTWDCPCHGSRYDTEGSVLEGPAVKSLARA
jgi:nucleotide-binding universal stress UspA family protein